MLPLELPKGATIYTYRRAGMSLGDVHIILMAFFMHLPIILSEDSDIDFLRSAIARKISRDDYNVEIYDVMDLVMMIAQNKETSISKKEIEKIVLNVNERRRLSEVKKKWTKNHSTP